MLIKFTFREKNYRKEDYVLLFVNTKTVETITDISWYLDNYKSVVDYLIDNREIILRLLDVSSLCTQCYIGSHRFKVELVGLLKSSSVWAR